MEPKIQSSFIPKKPISSTGIPKRSHRPVTLIFSLSLLVLIIAIVVSAGLFFYTEFLKNSIDEKVEMLEQARAAFAPAQIQTLQRIDTRINTANQLLGNHITPSLILGLLERSTLQNVQFDGLEYVLLPDGRISLRVEGTASSFASVALQSDSFADERSIQNGMFSDIDLDERGNAVFTFEAEIDSGAFLYKTIVESLPEAIFDIETSEEAETSTSTQVGGSNEIE